MTKIEADKLTAENERLRARNDELEKAMKGVVVFPAAPAPSSGNATAEELYPLILNRILKEPAIINLQRSKPELNVTVSRKTVQANETSAQGMIAILLSEGLFESAVKANAAWKELQRRWDYRGAAVRVYEQLDILCGLGFVTKESDGYQAVPDMKVNILKN